MRTLIHNINYDSRADQFRLYYLTDLHYGAAACDEHAIDDQIAKIANDPNARWIGGGDYIDCIARKGDKRYREATLAPWLWGYDDPIGAQRDYTVGKLSPIMDKCLGLVCGNHEYAALKYGDRDVYWEIVTWLAQRAKRDPLDLALGVQGFVVMRYRRNYNDRDSGGTQYGGTTTITAYCHHGYGGGRLPGGDALSLSRALGDYEAELILMGHRHKQQVVPKEIVKPSSHGGTAKVSTRYGVFCGHYLNSYIRPSGKGSPVDTYPEEKGLPPAPTGTPTITIKPSDKAIDVTLHMKAGDREVASKRLPKSMTPVWMLDDVRDAA